MGKLVLLPEADDTKNLKVYVNIDMETIRGILKELDAKEKVEVLRFVLKDLTEKEIPSKDIEKISHVFGKDLFCLSSQEIGSGIRFVKFAGEYINLAYVRRIYIHKQSNEQWEIVMVLEQHDYDSHVISEVYPSKEKAKKALETILNDHVHVW